MSKKKVRCFRYRLKLNNTTVENSYLKDVVNEIFDVNNNNDIKELNNGNLVNILIGEDSDNYLSLEFIKKVSTTDKDEFIETKDVDERYLFFRIGREKDIEGAIKRNIETWEGSGVIGANEQDSYNLEICTYILIDTMNGIILELFGRYAPTVKSLKHLLNKLISRRESDVLAGITFDYNNIMTDELINSLRDNGTRLGQVTYNYENPNLDMLIDIGFTAEQINRLKELDVFQLEINLKGRVRVPLTRTPDKIKSVLNSFRNAPQNMKDKLSFKGTTKSTSTKNYTFKEEEVTYNIDIPYERITDNRRIKLSLDDIAFEAYTRLYNLYSENITRIASYTS
ncbi:hypothetical protein CLLI_22780 [Clostridium liquoris]|jgi:hypothetical protein|uniref:Uncharacterized protein n=1 Tax=Clostridium liquoris TaxID=1289519 RepID=A0A2T0B1M7_9CLOT|nr:hypothetical protein [Clostridium liquoris]PRR77714.1 hypothetical protein CLLI_22780 [Clostridium liquoris]